MKGPKPKPTADRIMGKVEKLPDAPGCWLWTGTYDRKSGYGKAYSQELQRHTQAHRLSYETFVRPIPNDREIDHICRVRSCVNPDHLRAVTRVVNMTAPGTPASKGECLRGHVLDDANTYRDSNGHRSCRTCRKTAWQQWYSRTSAHGATPDHGAGRSTGTEDAVTAGPSSSVTTRVDPPEINGTVIPEEQVDAQQYDHHTDVGT